MGKGVDLLMKRNQTKILIIAAIAVAVIVGMSALNRPVQQQSPKPKSTNAKEVANNRSTRGSLPNTGSGDSGGKTDSTKKDAKPAKDPLFGLPVLTMENVDINPEKPADMPLADWEEYERQRYEMVQLKAYKFRETEPGKVVPHEIATVVPDAAKKYGIPEDLLAALLYTSSDGGHHQAEHDIEGGFGLMMLKESPQCDTLGEAAQLLGVSREDLIYNQKLNVEGGAAVLAQYYEDAKASGVADSEAWYMAISQYSGRPQPELAAALADQVAGNLMKGFEIDSDDGSGYFKQEPNSNPIFLPKNWKLAAVDPPSGATNQTQQANGADAGNPPAAPVQ
jgi:hypothetical protein